MTSRTALALIFVLGVLSFHDARPRGNSHIDYVGGDEWALDDLVSRPRFWKGALCLDTDYVRGRMMKTHIRVWPTGIVEFDRSTAIRWRHVGRAAQGQKHLRLAGGGGPPSQ